MTYIQTETGTFDPRVTQTKTIVRRGKSTRIPKSGRLHTEAEENYIRLVKAGVPAFTPAGETGDERLDRIIRYREVFGITWKEIGYRCRVSPSWANQLYLKHVRSL
jgi:hypothetical protein